jgi:starvation-inducible DNA-binding protein
VTAAKSAKSNQGHRFTAPGLSSESGREVAELLQERLHALNDLALTLKHVHWNVIGPHFIGVHQMLDPQVEAVRAMVDETAERIATFGASPVGTPGALVQARSWEDYAVARSDTGTHLRALDHVYSGVVEDHRRVVERFDDLDLVTQDMMIGQVQQLELFQWFVRAHLEDTGGRLPDSNGKGETSGQNSA